MKVTSIFSALSVANNIAAIPKTKKIQMGNVTTAKKGIIVVKRDTILTQIITCNGYWPVMIVTHPPLPNPAILGHLKEHLIACFCFELKFFLYINNYTDTFYIQKTWGK